MRLGCRESSVQYKGLGKELVLLSSFIILKNNLNLQRFSHKKLNWTASLPLIVKIYSQQVQQDLCENVKLVSVANEHFFLSSATLHLGCFYLRNFILK